MVIRFLDWILAGGALLGPALLSMGMLIGALLPASGGGGDKGMTIEINVK